MPFSTVAVSQFINLHSSQPFSCWASRSTTRLWTLEMQLSNKGGAWLLDWPQVHLWLLPDKQWQMVVSTRSSPASTISTPHWWTPIRAKQLFVALPSFVGWLGRGSLVATNRTSIPLAMVSVSLTWSGWANIQRLRPFFTNPLHWPMCTNSPSGLKVCSGQYTKVTLSQWNAACAVRKVEAGLGSWWSEPFLLRRGLGVLWPHLTPTAPETPEPHWKTCWRGYWQALHSMRCLNDYSLWYYCSTPNQTPVTVLRTSIHQWFWLRVLLWKTLLDSSVWMCMNCVGGGFTFVYHWTESYVCMTVF